MYEGLSKPRSLECPSLAQEKNRGDNHSPITLRLVSHVQNAHATQVQDYCRGKENHAKRWHSGATENASLLEVLVLLDR